MKKSTLNEVEDLNFAIPDLQYSSILHIPFYTRLLHHFYAYFGKINASISAPAFLGYFYYIIVIIQTFLPSLLIDCQDLWPRESLMTMILYVLGYIFQGSHVIVKSARVIMSLIISIIFIVLIIILIIRTEQFHKTGRVSSIEIKFIYFTFKYIMPLFCPHLMCGLPISFDQIVNQNKIDYNVLQIILSIVSFALYLYLFYVVISPRVLLEDTPSHDWFPLLSFSSILNTTLLAVISGIAGCVEGKSRSGCSIFIALQSIFLGLALFFTNGIIKAMITVVSSATCFSSFFTSILLTADIFLTKPLSPEILLIVSVIVFILLIIVLRILKQMKITKILHFLDSLMDSGDSKGEILSSNYKRPFNFLCDIRSVIELWHPLIAGFEVFDFAISKWPNDFNVLLLSSRIFAIFPNKNQQMMSVASKIASISERKNQNSYLYQFRHLARTRQTSMTPAFQDKLMQINSKTEIINDLLKRFWENILQKNTVNFWSDSDHVFSKVSDLDSLYAQLLDDYPNNYQLLNSYSQFVSNIKHDYDEAREMDKKLEILKKNGSVKTNLGIDIALQVFPLLNNFIQFAEYDDDNNQLNQEEKNSLVKIDDENLNDEMNELKNKNESFNDSNNQLECAVSELIKHSKVGSIWIVCSIIIIITILIIVLFYLFYDYFVSNFVNRQQKATDFMIEVDMFSNEFIYFLVNLNILPLVFEEGQENSPIAILDRAMFTETVAPELFAEGRVPEFSLSTEVVIDLLSKLKERFTRVIESLASLNKKEELVSKLNYIFYSDITYGKTLKDLTNNIFSIALEILQLKNPKEFFNKNNLYANLKSNSFIVFQQFSQMASLCNDASTNYESNFEKFNEIMILGILVTLFLLTLPYIIQLFLLIIQSESIAESFTLFPNTEIRSIINLFGKSSSKMEEDTTQVAALNNIRRTNKLSGVLTILTFIASFIMFIICSLIIYFTAKEFMDSAESISTEIYSLTPAFAALSYSFIHCFRLYMITHDGDMEHIIDFDSNLYAYPGDKIEDLLFLGSMMLNLSYQQFANGMFGKNGGLGAFNKFTNDKFDYFKDVFPTNTNDVAYSKTLFEELATDIFTESIDHISDFLFGFFFDQNYTIQSWHDPTFLSDPLDQMNDLIYWFSNFAETNRTQIFIKLVQEDVFAKIKKFESIPNACFCIIIVWQILAAFFMILFLVSRNKRIKNSLFLYQFIKPEILLQNQKALSLIESGKQITEENNVNSMNSDFIISKISQGFVLTDKKLIVTNYNESFIKKCQLNGENIIGENLTDLISDENQDKSWTSFIQHVEDALQGKHKTQFTDNFSVILKNGQTSHFSCTATCLTSFGISNSSNVNHIEKVAFLFDDNTENFMREKLIEREKKHLNEMLSNVMPARIVHSFVNSGECISFIVQSVSIGMVRIKALKKFDNNSPEEFTFYKEIFDRFDNEIKEFDLLTKSNSFSHTYTFIGGLFSEINKPERHAEESIKYALRLLNIVPELSEKYGVEIHLTIGVHTGGPIVAGVLSFEKPTFQIIGTVGEMANQIKNKGVPDQICITRAVYELIFSASFNVQEQGDTKIRGGKIIPTYLVRP